MDITFYSIQKRQNSTFTPTKNGTTYSCIIKDSCSIMSPVIKLDIGLNSNPIMYNYAYIPTWNRYYFISDWTFNTRLWEASLSIDVLTSHKREIGNSSVYVLRSASSYNNNVVDTSYPAQCNVLKRSEEQADNTSMTMTNPDWGSTTITSPFSISLKKGYFYVKILNNKNTLGYTMYVMDYDNFHNFIRSVFDITISISGISDDLAKVLANPIKYVTEVMWCPYLIPCGNMASQQLYIGFGYVLPNLITCAKVDQYAGFDCYAHIDVPLHPLASSRGNWCNRSPYSKYILTYLPFGQFTLNIDDFISETVVQQKASITLDIDIDIKSGKARLKGTAGVTGSKVIDVTSQFMVNIPVSQISTSILGIAGATVGSLAGEVASSGYLGTNKLTDYGTDLFGTVSNIGNAVANYGTGMTQNSSIDMINVFGIIPSVEGIFMDITDEDIINNGRPLCAYKQLSTLSGFILCKNGDIPLTATQQEKNAVSNYLTSGFFME